MQKSYAQSVDIKTITLVDVTTNDKITLSQYSAKDAVVVIFFCNNCPYSTFYIDRIKEFIKNYSDVQFILINSANSEFAPEESIENMATWVDESSIGIPYLADKNKTAMKAFGAKKCPEAFVIKTDNWQIAYHGAIDNNPQVAQDVSSYYLRSILDELKAGSALSTTYERPTGCIIK